MGRTLFGELLGRFADLSSHDVAEILEHQKHSRRRFGEIALAFRLCLPEHVWQAWWAQLDGEPQRIDLDRVGIDVQALAHLGKTLAEEFGVIPIRALANQLVIAASDASIVLARQALPTRIRDELRFVVAPAEQIQRALATAYAAESFDHSSERLAVPA